MTNSIAEIEDVDFLFVIDDSGSMFPSAGDPIGRTEMITLNGTSVDVGVDLVAP